MRNRDELINTAWCGVIAGVLTLGSILLLDYCLERDNPISNYSIEVKENSIYFCEESRCERVFGQKE